MRQPVEAGSPHAFSCVWGCSAWRKIRNKRWYNGVYGVFGAICSFKNCRFFIRFIKTCDRLVAKVCQNGRQTVTTFRLVVQWFRACVKSVPFWLTNGHKNVPYWHTNGCDGRVVKRLFGVHDPFRSRSSSFENGEWVSFCMTTWCCLGSCHTPSVWQRLAGRVVLYGIGTGCAGGRFYVSLWVRHIKKVSWNRCIIKKNQRPVRSVGFW